MKITYKRISFHSLKPELEKYNIDKATQAMIQNQVLMYNDALTDHINGDGKAKYLLMQIGGNINKIIMDFKKMHLKQASEEASDDDQLTKLITSINNQTKETRN